MVSSQIRVQQSLPEAIAAAIQVIAPVKPFGVARRSEDEAIHFRNLIVLLRIWTKWFILFNIDVFYILG